MIKQALALGGGVDQLALIRKLRERGYYVVVVDRDQNAPGSKEADEFFAVSTMATEQVLDIARKSRVSTVGVISADQPLLTATAISEELGLYYPISHKQALQVTNKQAMKQLLAENGIPTAKYAVVRSPQDFRSAARALTYPLVVKPVDSSASRGVQKINDHSESDIKLREALAQSRSGTCIVEEYCTGQEISVDAAVLDSRVSLVMTTYRLTADHIGRIGLCRVNAYPTSISESAQQRISQIVGDIARALHLENSLLFLQMVVDGSAVHVFEFSARNAGASKQHFIQMVTGLDVIELYTRILLRERANVEITEQVKYATCNYLYCHEGRLHSVVGLEELYRQGIVSLFEIYRPANHVAKGMYDGADRVGAFFVADNTLEELVRKTQTVDEQISIRDEHGQDIMVHGLHQWKGPA